MSGFNDLISKDYKLIIEKTDGEVSSSYVAIENILNEIREHISGIDESIYCRRNDLLVAIRLVEAFRIYNWIKVCLACGSYQSIFRELRFMLDGMAQACYIDLNHMDASLESKLEVFKALCLIGGFIGKALFNKLKDFSAQKEIAGLYKELSNYVHPSIEESRSRIESPPSSGVIDSLKFNTFDKELLNFSINKCKQVGNLLISIDNYFIEKYMQNKNKEKYITNSLN